MEWGSRMRRFPTITNTEPLSIHCVMLTPATPEQPIVGRHSRGHNHPMPPSAR